MMTTIAILLLCVAVASVYVLLALTTAVYKLTAAVKLADENAAARTEIMKDELRYLRDTFENESTRWMAR